ncbi:MAG: acetate kinase [Nitrospiraceae bacterium]|nr:MAG: acetate kinase [Nitrospiraceae bacterium]
MNVLVINSGSSSIKYKIFNMSDKSVLASGVIDRIGEPVSSLKHRWMKADGEYEEISLTRKIDDHSEGLQWITCVSEDTGLTRQLEELFGIGHRVVHGGEVFQKPAVINDKVIETIREMAPLAPLHNPANLVAIEAAVKNYPDVPQVAVFDTAFHQTMPPHAFHYAVPYELYKNYHVRRYGFHGTSHQFVSKQAAAYLGRPPEEINLITLHIGNGVSAAAVRGGRSIDTSMGMTPLEGLIMGTRCGDIDPSLPFYIAERSGLSINDIERMLNKESGLKGICGANDMREIISNSGKDDLAKLAIDMFCYRIKKYIGAYHAVLGRTDAIVFTGGIGENAGLIRARCCEGLEAFGIKIDEQKNASSSGAAHEINKADAKVRILVIPTNEELEIAGQTVETILAAK